jgi:large subunit ribosomal protein L31
VLQVNIHPNYQSVKVKCACGAEYQPISTASDDYTIDICSACHPVYTGGTQRLVDTEGRIERFKKKYQKKD